MKKRLTALLLSLLCLSGCGGNGGGKDLTQGLQARSVDIPQSAAAGDEASALAGFSLDLLRENWDGEENVLVSPLSVLSALGMTANGARGETRTQMEAALGLPAENLNAALAAWRSGLRSEKGCRVDLANAIWLRDDGSFEADQDFLQTVADWYRAEVFASRFAAAAVKEVNGWVEKNTHGMIDSIVEKFPDDAVMCLVNALALEAEWETIYREDQVWDDRFFTTSDGREQPATLMYSSEWTYLKDENAQGFLKPYKGGRWAFAALLPDEGVTLEEYAASLTGERLHSILAGAEEREVHAAIPKFTCEYSADLTDSLKAMGITDAFDMDRADLSGLGTSSLGPLYISQVLHKTYISVDEKGTRAGAATAVIPVPTAAMKPEPTPVVHLDRPFLYMLVDTETDLPAFIGVVTHMEA